MNKKTTKKKISSKASKELSSSRLLPIIMVLGIALLIIVPILLISGNTVLSWISPSASEERLSYQTELDSVFAESLIPQNSESGGDTEFTSSRVIQMAAGYVDRIDVETIYGWAGNQEEPDRVITIEFYVNGKYKNGGVLIGTTQTGNKRPDVTKATGLTAPAFHFSVPNAYAKEGTKVYVYGVFGTNRVELAGSGKEMVTTPAGAATNNNISISGWAVNPLNQDEQLSILVYADKKKEEGGKLIAEGRTNIANPDLQQATGYTAKTPSFVVAVPTSERKNSRVYHVYAKSSNGKEALLYVDNKSYADSSPRGWVDTIRDVSVSGWAFDPDNSNKSIKVVMTIDKPLSQNGTVIAEGYTREQRIDVKKFFRAEDIYTNCGFTLTIPVKYRQSGKQIYVQAINLENTPGTNKVLMSKLVLSHIVP